MPLPQVADLLHMLADVRLTTREACYNTVRNVTACPLAGIHPEEPFDVQPYARRVAFAFLHKELTDSLPRKFKIAFAGCPEDCIATAINDVGLRAVIRDGVKGFRMTVAGGLGPLPTEAKLLHEFIPADDLVRRIEAVIRVFNVHGNRKNKNKARLKFVMRERGFDWLRDTIEEQYQDILKNGGIAMPDRSAGELRRLQVAATTAGVGRPAAGVGAFFARVRRVAQDQRASAEAEGLLDRHRDDAAGQPDRRSDARLGRHCRSGGRRIPALLDDPECDLRLGSGWRSAARLRSAGQTEFGRRRRRRNHRRDHVPRRLQLQPGAHQDHGLGRGAAKRAAESDRSADPQAAHQRERLPEFLRPALDRRHRFLRQRAQDDAPRRQEGSAVLPDAAGRHAVRSSAWRCRAFRRDWLRWP